MNFLCLLLSLCFIHKAMSLPLFDNGEFVRIILQLQECLSNMSSTYTMCLYDGTEFQIRRVDGNPIDLDKNDTLLSDCINKVSTNYTIQTDLEAILATDNFEETSETSDVSYTSASGPFGHYEWGSLVDIDTNDTNSSQIINGSPVLMSIRSHWDSGSCGSGFNHVHGKRYTNIWNDMAKSS